ncbi:uncharacterized protein BX664DRAFT_388933 [Halteromyces radiatus]|uniref:uncharacterized protein n=1 Tax=Halteromyces radiatus TaxID=101107 RepID=UPI00221F4CB8|nr:uncharacterized protein BX664DRAFT_388933 [Halteromyces radiatus]KAI8079986.1 hypothetical protein BX664DRAFT_388933 [Halteromyces radiatus]
MGILSGSLWPELEKQTAEQTCHVNGLELEISEIFDKIIELVSGGLSTNPDAILREEKKSGKQAKKHEIRNPNATGPCGSCGEIGHARSSSPNSPTTTPTVRRFTYSDNPERMAIDEIKNTIISINKDIFNMDRDQSICRHYALYYRYMLARYYDALIVKDVEKQEI